MRFLKAALAVATVYTFVAFVKLEANPTHWEEGQRFFAGLLSLIAIGGFLLEPKE